MSFENVYRYTNESINLCHDVLDFYIKKKDIEYIYSQTLSKLCQTFKAQYNSIINQQQNTPELIIKSNLLQNSLWKTFINQIDEFDQTARYHKTLAISYDDSVIQPLTTEIDKMELNQKKIIENGFEKVKILQDAYTELKKKKELYKEAQDQAKEAAEAHNKGLNTYNIKDKEMEKLNQKYQSCLEKVTIAKEVVDACELLCKKYQEKYYFGDLPVILENLKSKEEERSYFLKELLIEGNKMEKLSIQYINNINNTVAEGLKDIDISNDIESFTQNYMYSFNHDTDISVRSLINPEKAGRMNFHKDTGTMEWRSRYFVLMSKHFRLYSFESEDSVMPKEIIDLNDVSIHLLDDSYFNLSNCFQIVVYNNIKEKTRRKAFVYYFVAESAKDRLEWFSQIRDIAYCCQTCNITKTILYEYSKKIHGQEVHHQHPILAVKASEVSESNCTQANGCECNNNNNNNHNNTSNRSSNRNSNSSNSNNLATLMTNNNNYNSNSDTNINNNSEASSPVLGDFKRTNDITPLNASSKNTKSNKSLITFAEALGDPLMFLKSQEEMNEPPPPQIGITCITGSPSVSTTSLNKILKSPNQSQKSLIQSHDDQPTGTIRLSQRYHDKKQNRYSMSILDSVSKTSNSNNSNTINNASNGNLKRETSIENGGSSHGGTLKKDSSFFRMIKNNAKNLNSLFTSGSDESIDELSRDESSGLISSKQNCRYSIISNIPPVKMSQYSMTAYNGNLSNESLNNMFEYLNDKNKYRINRSIRLCVQEARNISPNEKKKNLEYYAYIFFDDIVQAKTSKQVGPNPFWGEEFNFENVLPCLKSIHIVVCQQHRVSSDTEFGYIVIPIHKLHSNKKVEEWIPLLSLNSNVENLNASIRVSVTLMDEHILPIEDYNEFVEYVCCPTLEPVIRLGNVVQQREEFAKTLLYVLMDRQKEVEGIKTLVSLEIKNTDDPNIIFRGNSLTTKIIDQYMKLVGSRYLNNTLRRQVQNIYAIKESCEVDPSKIDKSEDMKKHWKKLLSYVNSFWEAIRQSIPKCPSKLREVFSYTKMEVAKTFENESTVQYSSISGFIFLRFFCPAILSPKLFGLAEQHPEPVTARTLTLIAKILQNLANLTEFASKEPHMSESNQFIISHMSEMKYFIDAISIPPDKMEENAVVDYDVRSQCEKFYRFYRSNAKSCFNVQNPEDKKMLDIIQNISNIHIKYREDLLNYQVSIDDCTIKKMLSNSEISLRDLINEEVDDEQTKVNESSGGGGGGLKKELSNFIIEEYNNKEDMDESLKNILFTIRRFSSIYNKKDTTKRQYNPMTKITGINQFSPYIEEIYSPSNRSSMISNSNIDALKLDEIDNRSVYSAPSYNELNAPPNKLNHNSNNNSVDSISSNSIHSNHSLNNNNNNNNNSNNNNSNNNGRRSMEMNNGRRSTEMNNDDDNELISLTEGLSLGDIYFNSNQNLREGGSQSNSKSNTLKTKNSDISRANSSKSGNSNSNHFLKIFTNLRDDGGGSSNYNTANGGSPINSPTTDGSYYTTVSGGGNESDGYQTAPFSPSAKRRFPTLNIKRKFSSTLSSITGNSSHLTPNAHRDHGKIGRDY